MKPLRLHTGDTLTIRFPSGRTFVLLAHRPTNIAMPTDEPLEAYIIGLMVTHNVKEITDDDGTQRLIVLD